MSTAGIVLLFLNIGSSEMILIVFVALLLFGGDKLPVIARTLGKGIRDFKDASEGVKREISNQINSYEEKKTSEPVVNHIDETAPETERATHPLIDTTPVAGTMAIGTRHETDIDQAMENHVGDTHVHSPAADAVTTIHEHEDHKF